MSFGSGCFRRRDPIGVADYFPNTADEYDGYAPQVVQALRKGGNARAIAAHLGDVERQSMDGPLTSPERLTYLGSLIRDWYANSQDAWSDFGPMRRSSRLLLARGGSGDEGCGR